MAASSTRRAAAGNQSAAGTGGTECAESATSPTLPSLKGMIAESIGTAAPSSSVTSAARDERKLSKQFPAVAAQQGGRGSVMAAAAAAAEVATSLRSPVSGTGRGRNTSMSIAVSNSTVSTFTTAAAKVKVSFGGTEVGGTYRGSTSGDGGDRVYADAAQRTSLVGGGSIAPRASLARGGIRRRTSASRRGSSAVLGKRSSVVGAVAAGGGSASCGGCGGSGAEISVAGNGGVSDGGGGGGRHRRRAKQDFRGEGDSGGSMDSLTTTSVSTVTRGVPLHWRPRLNTDLGSFVYPSLMLEKNVGLHPEGGLHAAGGHRKGAMLGKIGYGMQRNDGQQARRKRSLSSGALGGDAGAAFQSQVTLPSLTWELSMEPERQSQGVVTFQFSPNAGNGDPGSPSSSGGGGNPTFEIKKDTVTSSISKGETGRRTSDIAAGWEPWQDCSSLPSSKLSGASFADCLKTGEAKLREDVRRLQKELKETPATVKEANIQALQGAAVLATQARNISINEKARAVAAAMSTKGRASAVQYDKLLNRPGNMWGKANRIVKKLTFADFRDIKNRDKVEMRAELKRLEKERQEEEGRRLAKEFEEKQLTAKMANGRLRQIVSAEEKLQAKISYFSQFHQAARTRYAGHFSTGSVGVWPDRGITQETGGHRRPITASTAANSRSQSPKSRPSTSRRSTSRRSTSRPSTSRPSTSRPSSRGFMLAKGRPGSPMIPQGSEGSKRQAMARDVFIVACLQLGLHPDLSQVRWNAGTIDLAHFGLGDQIVEALAESLKHTPPETLSLRDNRLTDAPLGVVISALNMDSLLKLNLSENRVGPKAMGTLCAFLEGGSCLETLVLTATSISDAELAPLCNTLVDNDTLLSLNLSRNNLRSAGASSLAKMLASPSCGLEDLDISWNCCSGKGTVELGEALRRQGSLRKLELAFNSFSNDSTMALAMALLDNRQLTSLGLSWNRVGGHASLALSRMLSLNSTLRKMDLSGNPLTETGGRSIVRALLAGSGCDVAMRECTFLEDTSILFDRNYPPPLMVFDLDLKNIFQCCVLHELIGLAQAKPGSKFVEVYRHAGDGRSRVPLSLQVVEEQNSLRRATVMDANTGKPWNPPDSGWISVKFRVSRELPSIEDVLSQEAAWTAMMLIIGQESDSDRANILRLVLRDTYVTTESGQNLIDQLSNMGIYPRDVVEMVWTRVVDASNLYEFLSHNVEHSARRDVVNILTHERFKFNWDNPTGHYRLEMDKQSHREIMMLLSMVHAREIMQGKREGRGDTSQAQNWSNFRNASIDKESVELTETSAMNLPVSGVLEFDYVSTAKAPIDSVPATDAQVQALQESLQLLPRRSFGEKTNYMLAVLQLQQAAARYYFTTPQVIRILDCFEHTKLQASAVTALFGRTWDLENFDAVFATLPAGVDMQAASRLGYLNVLNPLKIARHYELNIMHPDERRLIKLLLDTSPLEKGDNLLEDHTSDLQVIDLYAGLGRLVDEKRPIVVRLWYCDFGIRGNVPNWTVREKLLDKFLVGGKPVPDRVLDIVRMYKRMAEAGFLAKEPGMGAADIAKAYERFLKYQSDLKRFPPGGQSRGGRRSLSSVKLSQVRASARNGAGQTPGSAFAAAAAAAATSGGT